MTDHPPANGNRGGAGGEIAALVETLRRPLGSMPDPLPLAPMPGAFDVELTPPGSKSLTNRLLMLAAMARGDSRLRRPLLDADDTDVMIEALRRMGAVIERERSGDGDWDDLRIRGVGGRPVGGLTLDLHNAGTATRFLAAAAALADGPIVIDGNERMRQRPIGELATALRALRVSVDFLGEYGCPPLRITPPAKGERLRGGSVRLESPPSSQFVSALLLAAPWMREGLELEIAGEMLSRAYVVMTLRTLRRAGVSEAGASKDLRRIVVAPDPIAGFDLAVEPDASGATYFWAAAAMTQGSSCLIRGVGPASVQSDARFAHVLGTMGASVEEQEESIRVSAPPGGAPLRGIRTDFSDMPDAAMTLASAAAFAHGPTGVSGLATLKVKECDRLVATRDELRKIGARVEAGDDALIVHPASQAPEAPVAFDTYDDHRMAMALSLIGLRRPGVAIRNPGCVVKTYPTFWRDWSRLYEAATERLRTP